MAQIEFVVPEAVTNYFTNPRLGTGDTTGLTAVLGSVLTSLLTRARWGVYSVRVVTAGAVINEGVFATTAFAGAGAAVGAWAESIYLRGEGTVRVRLLDFTNTVQYISDEVVLNDDRWQRVGVWGAIPAGCVDMRLYVETVGIEVATFYVDGIQVEPNEYITTYTDGDLELELPPHDGYTYFQWNGTIHASTSSRSADYRSGGKTEVIENVDTELFVTDLSGTGMPPIQLNVSQYASMDRATIDSWRTMPRVVTLHFWTKRRSEGDVCFPADLSELHEQRQKLENIVKPDKTLNPEPFLMRYSDGHDDRKLEMFVHYEGGLEWSGDIRYPYINDFFVRFLAVDPYWYEDTQDVPDPAPTGTQTLANADYIIARIDGEWAEPGDTDGNVFKIAVHPTSGDIYVGGAFTTIDNGATANTEYIARWDGAAWNSLGGALNIFDATVRAIDFLANGDVMIGGEFVNVGAVVMNRITRYDPVLDTFSTVGAPADIGFDNTVRDFAVDDSGFVYVGGDFVQDSTPNVTYNYIAYYDPTANTFATVGAGVGLDGTVVALAMDNDGITVYVGGNFDRESGGVADTLVSICQFDPTNSFQAMGTGVDTPGEFVNDILVAHDNRVYVVGEFDHIGFIDAEHFAIWNGREWYPPGVEGDGFTIDGAGSTVRALAEDYKNLILIGGDIDGATDADLYRGFGSWNRSRFQHADMVMPTNHVYTIATRGDDRWIGFNNDGSSVAAEVFTIENIGRTTTYPTLEILGPCYIEWFENQTTGQIVRINLDILAGERVIFDFKPWNRFVRSSHRGNVIKSILADSDEIRFLPGDNVLALFCEDTNQDTEISLRWPIIHWGFDDLR